MKIYNMTKADIRGAVSRGARLLDDKEPDWAIHIDLDDFNIEDLEWCAIGQLHESFSVGCDAILGLSHSHRDIVAHGFDMAYVQMPDDSNPWAYAQIAWEHEIRDRRQQKEYFNA